MFSYNCEKCGREVPPAYSECPDCAAKEAAAGVAAASNVAVAEMPPSAPAPVYPPSQPMVAAPPAYTPPPAQPVPQMAEPPRMAQQPAAPPPPPQMALQQRMQPQGGGTPGWVIALLVSGLLGLGGYILIDKGLPWWRGRNDAVASETPAAATAAASQAAPSAAAASDTKYLQITGLRLFEANRKPQISMVVVNHAAAELVGINATVLIHTTKDATTLAKLELKLSSIGGNEVRDVTMPFPTKLRAYELPDWQFLVAELVPGK